ncbi:DNA polymerase III subunit delta [Motilibacter aurantiacus]|uniref:DNA polymerase III subunit delta n=1 Tax=Motilibacter aurantiacus TaxID=2714955 RepID=UPI00140CDCF0|nr:DNA polymerase III subunit delta [Motilibacter aurantiacus]
MARQPTGSSITLVQGPEELLAERAVADAVKRARESGAAPDVVEVSAVGLGPGELAEAASPSLFADRLVVIVRDVADAGEAAAKELLAYLAAPSEDVALVLVHKGGVRGKKVVDAAKKAGAQVVECAEVKRRGDKIAFLRKEFRSHRKRVGEEAVETLLEAVGGDLRSLAAAAAQLASDIEGEIDADAVRRYHAGRAEVTGFAVADAAVEGRSADALVALRWALQTGTDPVLVTSALAGALRTIGKVAAAGRNARAGDLGLPPWKLDVARRQARGWSADALAAAIRVAARTDEMVKGGGADPAYALERAVVEIAAARAAA